MSAIHCGSWRAGGQGEPPQADSDAAAPPSIRPAEGLAVGPQQGAVPSEMAAHPGTGALGGPTPTVALALVTLFPDLTPTALQHMLGLG